MSDTPNLHEILQLLEDDGLVGEEANALCCAVLYPAGNGVAITGPASTGKTWMMERVERLYRKSGDTAYHMPTNSSPTAIFYDHKAVNAHNVHIWGDITEMPSEWESILKALLEGKPADRKVTDITMDGGEGGADDKIVYPPRTSFVLFASNNQGFHSDELPELISRMVVLSTDASEEQTKRILQRQSDIGAGLYKKQIDGDRADEVHDHMAAVMQFAKLFTTAGGVVLDPVLPEITRNEVIPSLFPEARRDLGKLQKFMGAMAMFHFADRVKGFDANGTPQFHFNEEGKPVLYVTPEDAWLAMKVFGERLVMSALGLVEEDIAMLALLRDRKSAMTASKVRELLAAEAGINLTRRDVSRRLESMGERGYITPNDDESPKTYQPGMFATQMDHSTSLPWSEVIESAIENAREGMPAEAAEEYIEKFCRNPTAVHPLTGDEVSIVDDDSFDTELAEASQELEGVFAEPLWATDESDDSDTTDDGMEAPATETPDPASGQGTLT